jgi:C-terminal processing protease CtpA/Prc
MKRLFLLIAALALLAISCQALTSSANPTVVISTPVQVQVSPIPLTQPPQPATPAPADNTSPTPNQASPNTASSADEPFIIRGEITYTSPFFLNSAAEPFVMLEDEAGFVKRDKEFKFPLPSQVLGPVDLVGDGKLNYTLLLPEIPQGTYVDVDNNGQQDRGVQVFVVAYWSNTWGDPFLETRDGEGWSTGYASTLTDPDRDDEITGGKMVIWAPDDQQSFPTGFGPDNKLFTDDDPTAPVPAGYSIVDLDTQPFTLTKQSETEITLNEGVGAVTDYSTLSYTDAFEALFEKASREYPFTQDKGIDWNQLHDHFSPIVAAAKNDADFYRAIRDFTYAIPDGHVGVSIDPQVFYDDAGGSFGMTLAELSDGSVVVTHVLPGLPAEAAGIEVGAEIIAWNGKPVSEAIDNVIPYFGPYSTETARRVNQVIFLTRTSVGNQVDVEFSNPGDTNSHNVSMQAVVDYDSLFQSIPSFNEDALGLPIEAKTLADSGGLAYIRMNTFSDDYNLMARLWERAIKSLIDNKTPGVILDLRQNPGGSSGLARDFAGYFYTQPETLYRRSYYNNETGQFEYVDPPFDILPGPENYSGPIAVLVSTDCVSACEGFVYSLTQLDNVTVVGNTPSAGAFGEVGRGQYDLPGGLSMQFPTGRSETPDGNLLIEGTGIKPDILVPVTVDSAINGVDSVLQAAIDTLQ